MFCKAKREFPSSATIWWTNKYKQAGIYAYFLVVGKMTNNLFVCFLIYFLSVDISSNIISSQNREYTPALISFSLAVHIQHRVY